MEKSGKEQARLPAVHKETVRKAEHRIDLGDRVEYNRSVRKNRNHPLHTENTTMREKQS